MKATIQKDNIIEINTHYVRRLTLYSNDQNDQMVNLAHRSPLSQMEASPTKGLSNRLSGPSFQQGAEKQFWHARTSIVRTSWTSPVCLVDLVCFVYLVHLVCLVSLVQPNKQDKPNKPIKRDRPDRPNRPNERDRLADFFSILLEACFRQDARTLCSQPL